MIEKIRPYTRYLILIGTVIIVVGISLLFFVNNKNKADPVVDAGEVEINHDYSAVTSVLCRLELADIGVYEVALAGGDTYVFKDKENIGKSEYSVVSREAKKKEDDIGVVEIDINEYADNNIKYKYDIEEKLALEYIEYLKSIGYTELARVYTDSFIEGTLEHKAEDGNDIYTRYIIANDALIIKDISDNNAFGSDYYIDNYIK